MPFPHEAILGFNFFSALVDAFLHHSWPSATHDREMHQLVLRKKLNPRIASCGIHFHFSVLQKLDSVKNEFSLSSEVQNMGNRALHSTPFCMIDFFPNNDIFCFISINTNHIWTKF